MVCASNGMVYLLDLPSLLLKGEFSVNGTVTASFNPDGLPNNLLFGIEEGCALKLLTQAGEILLFGAH